MRPSRITCLATVFCFCFAVLAPAPLAAAENAQRLSLSSVKEFLVKDWAQSKSDMKRLGDFLARDFARTRADFSAVRARLATLKLAASAKDRGGQLRDHLQRLRETLADRLNSTIDEMGVRQFAATVEKISGAPLVAGAEGKDERMVRARMTRQLDEAFLVVTGEMERSEPGEVVETVKEADGLVEQMSRGATPEQLVESLRARHFGPDDGKKVSRGPGFFKAVAAAIKTLFMVSACGAISLVSLGFLSYGLASGGLVFVAAGGAAVVACLYGVVYYIAQGIRQLRKASPPRPVPDFALEGAR